MLRLLKIQNAKGFTLLELMMSMVIMSIAFLGILPLFFMSQAQIKKATLTNMAMAILQDKMDRIRGLDYDLINYTDFDDSAGFTDMPEYTYILPDVTNAPCTSFVPNPCGWVSDSSSPYYNKLLDVVMVDNYYFTRIVDVDDPDDRNSLEHPEDFNGIHDNLPSGGDTKRISVYVFWTLPGGKSDHIGATMEKSRGLDYAT